MLVWNQIKKTNLLLVFMERKKKIFYFLEANEYRECTVCITGKAVSQGDNKQDFYGSQKMKFPDFSRISLNPLSTRAFLWTFILKISKI